MCVCLCTEPIIINQTFLIENKYRKEPQGCLLLMIFICRRHFFFILLFSRQTYFSKTPNKWGLCGGVNYGFWSIHISYSGVANDWSIVTSDGCRGRDQTHKKTSWTVYRGPDATASTGPWPSWVTIDQREMVKMCIFWFPFQFSYCVLQILDTTLGLA